MVHIYRNRSDDHRSARDLHFCPACKGWYGVPHDMNHCQHPRKHFRRAANCACAPCRTEAGRPIQGEFGFFTSAKAWQP